MYLVENFIIQVHANLEVFLSLNPNLDNPYLIIHKPNSLSSPEHM